MELPKEVPKLSRPLFGFTKTAEIWNSRACMIGLIGTFIVELVSTYLNPYENLVLITKYCIVISVCSKLFQIFNKGILEMIGVEIGKGLDIPL